jgi:dTDP-4-amino-4,6-dideoxygalactose transaminase/nucleoside-diphosphate-sugar epimerase
VKKGKSMIDRQSILLVGAGGYLGSVLTPMLLEEGYQVIAFDKFYFGEQTLAEVAGHPRCRIVKGDVRAFDPSLLDGVDSVLYMAALSNDPACELDSGWTESVNRDAAVRIAQMSKIAGVKRFLFCSSCSVYGFGGDSVLTEASELRPVSIYARTKIEAEKEILALSNLEFHPVALRKATLFGLSPRMRFDLAINVMTLHGVKKKRIYVTGGGDQWRPFLHVRDAARAYQLCLSVEPEKISGRTFNVASCNLKIRDLAELVGLRTGAQVHIVPEDADRRDYRVSAELFERTLGFKATETVEDAIDSIASAITREEFGDAENARFYTLKTLKLALETPAIEGGESVRKSPLPFGLPLLGKAEEDEVLDTLRSGWITTGPKTKRFEDMCREYLGCRHAIAVNSCTAALHTAVAAARIGPGDEVITTPISWPATASVVIQQGATPVFVDVEEETLNIDATKIEAAITPRTKAILPVHMAGQPCDLDAIREIARRHGLMVIEDAAHAIGAEYHGKKIGSISEATAFSLYPIKNITTIEGGILSTDDDDFADRARMISNHGISRDAWKRYSAEGSLHWQLMFPGFKYNMTDIQASLGLHQLPRLDEFVRTRASYVAMYDNAFAEMPAIRPLASRPGMRSAHHLYIVRIQPEYLSITRDELMLALRAERIGTGVHFVSMHLQPYYRDHWGMKPEDLPIAAGVSQQLLSLPLYPKMTTADVGDVIHAVQKLVQSYGKTSEAKLSLAFAES